MDISSYASAIVLWLLLLCFILCSLKHGQATNEVHNNTILNVTEFITAISSIDNTHVQPNDDLTTSSKMKIIQVVFKDRTSTVNMHIYEDLSLDIIIPRIPNTIANQSDISSENDEEQHTCLSLRIRNSFNNKTGHLMNVKSTEGAWFLDH